MAMTDEIREQQKKLKGQSFKAKLSYFWDYYKVHTLAGIAAVILLSFFISDYIESNKECVLYALMLNGYPVIDTNVLMDEFLTESGYEPDKVHAYPEGNMSLSLETTDTSSVASMQKISVLAQSSMLDVVIATDDVTEYYAEQSFFYDLRDILPEDMLKQYEENDLLVFHEISPTDSTLVPVGIKGEAFPRLKEMQAYDYEDAAPVVSVIVSTKQPDNAIRFTEFLGDGQ